MFKSLGLAVVALAVIAPVWAADPAPTPPPDPAQVMKQLRVDMQAARTDVIAKGLTLTADQAAKFWPLFQQYQTEQSVIIDTQLNAVQKYADNSAKLTEADALAYVNSLLERDQKMHDLQVKWITKFQSVVPASTAARVIHLDRRLSLVGQLQLASKIPLVH